MNLNWSLGCLISFSFPVLKDPQSLILITFDKFISWPELSGTANFQFSHLLNVDLDGFLVVFLDLKESDKTEVKSDYKPGSIKIAEGWHDAEWKHET